MRRVLIAWELGGNWGHLGRDLPLALALAHGGYEVHLAVRDVRLGAALLTPHGLPFVQAPLPEGESTLRRRPENYAGVLWACGYGDRGQLFDLLDQWLHLFDTLQPDVVIADFAPGAMLAARVGGLPLAVIGLGFEVPPPLRPLPPIRPWRAVAPAALVAVEDAQLATLNEVLAQRRLPPLGAVHEIFPRAATALTTFPELDHHLGLRPEGNFVGPVYSTPPDAVAPMWPPRPGPRLLAYLSPETRGLRAVLAALRAKGTVIACVPGAGPAHPGGGPGAHGGSAHSRALQLDALLPRADMVITNGSLATSTRALLAGIPVLAVPNVAEQHLGAMRIAELGAGLIVDRRRTERDVGARLSELMAPRYRDAARLFAGRYAGESQDKAVARVINLVRAAVLREPLQTRARDSQ